MHIERKEQTAQEALRQTISYLRDHWFDENVGIVAATIVENHLMISATSIFLPEEKCWLHAEAAALDKFEKQFGRKPKPSSIMISTLSPCLQTSTSRYGDSCSHRLLASGITHIGFGHLDKKQSDFPTYKQLGFTAFMVGNEAQQKTCASLSDLFDNHILKPLKNSWPEIKQIIRLEPFAALQ